jgi:hypothetical protein
LFSVVAVEPNAEINPIKISQKKMFNYILQQFELHIRFVNVVKHVQLWFVVVHNF